MPKQFRLGLALLAGLLVAGLFGAVAPGSAVAAPKPGVRLYVDQQRGSFFRHGSGRVRFGVRAVPCQGFAAVRVEVDGVRDRTIALRRTALTTYWTRTTYGPGKHRITFTLLRDKRVVSKKREVCNRRITVGRIRMTRPMPLPEPTVPTSEPTIDPTASPSAVPTAEPVPGDADGSFTLAVLGDTQNEVYAGRTTFGTRTAWLGANKTAQDIRFVAQTGDLTSFGWKVPSQYDEAAAAMQKLTAAGLPWQVSAGNHDTRAVGYSASGVGYGGSAWVYDSRCRSTDFGLEPLRTCATSDSNALLRRADELTARLPVNPSGAQSSGVYVENTQTDPRARSFNSWATFSAVGRRWLVLNLEAWPRRAVIAWAQGVVASHADDNVIIQTHDYLTQGGGLAGNDGYGNETASYLAANLVAKYPNIKMVLSGHEGLANSATFTYGAHKVVAYLGNETASIGVTRLVDIDVRTGTVSSRWWAGTANLDSAPTGTTSDTGFTFQ